MLVYGDRQRRQDPRAMIGRIAGRLAGLDDLGGIARHGALAAAFIEAGELAQGLADAEFEQRGGDGRSPEQDAAMAVLMRLAAMLAASWHGEPPPPPPDLEPLAALPLPASITTKTPEGYAFYAVYPEAYLEAAAGLQAPKVIGLRSIGTGLAAMVAVATGAEAPVTLRPVGHPFARELRLLLDLRRELAAPAPAWAIVDEGPGLSGSSFAAVADLLEAAGVPAERIVFLPSHGGDLGPQASARHRARWRTARRRPADFDGAILPRLPGWFADLVGEPAGPLEDISGGRWRPGAPADPQRERRKYLLRTDSGTWLLKFAGLGAVGEAKLERARALHAAGFTPEPLAVRHGFLIERWHGEARPLRPEDRPALLDRLARYLAFRTERFPAADEDGASPEALRDMAVHNAAEAGIDIPVPTPPPVPVRRVRTDNRLHAWEWLRLPDGRILKADALDHDDAHDLIGGQDIAWDVAGAAVEFALSGPETERLRRAVGADAALLAFCLPCYAAFQLGLWTMAGDGAQAARYRQALAATG